MREEIENFAKEELKGKLPAGFDHFKRTYKLAKKLNDEFDDEILHAATFLHDIGQGEDPHQKKSAEIASEFLNRIKFPENKIDLVWDAIINHVPTGNPISVEAKMLHDADLLDFLGATGIARLSGMTAEDWWEKDSLSGVLDIWENFCLGLCAENLILDRSKEFSKNKIELTKAAIKQLKKEIE